MVVTGASIETGARLIPRASVYFGNAIRRALQRETWGEAWPGGKDQESQDQHPETLRKRAFAFDPLSLRGGLQRAANLDRSAIRTLKR